MRQSYRSFLAAAALAVGAAGLAVAPAAAQSYPRVVGQGENLMVDYGPMGQGALVGGGRVTISQPSGMNVEIMHLDSMFVQQPREGFVPVIIGQGENQMTLYIPAAMMEQLRRARANPVR